MCEQTGRRLCPWCDAPARWLVEGNSSLVGGCRPVAACGRHVNTALDVSSGDRPTRVYREADDNE